MMGNVEQGRAASVPGESKWVHSQWAGTLKKQGQEHYSSCLRCVEGLLWVTLSAMGQLCDISKGFQTCQQLWPWPASSLASGTGGGKQSMPAHKRRMRPSYGQGCPGAIRALCSEKGVEQLCGIQQDLVGRVALAGPAALHHLLAFSHQVHFLLLPIPVGLNFPLPGALWLGQGSESLGDGGERALK